MNETGKITQVDGKALTSVNEEKDRWRGDAI